MKRTSPALYLSLFISLSLGVHAEPPSQHVIDSILRHQRDSGGWPKNIDYTAPFDTTALLQAKSETDFTIDNGATTEEMEMLAQEYLKTENVTYRTAFLKGLRFCLKAQYDNGGWPQRFPDTSGYHGQITFNDNAMIKVMTLLERIAVDERYEFVGQELREQADEAVDKGITCILKCQIMINGKPSVWCAQHDRKTYQPVTARSYELPSFSGSESVGIVRFLMQIDSPSSAVIQSIEGAIHWFKAHEIKGYKVVKTPQHDSPNGGDRIVVSDPKAPGMWARFYDLKTIQPFFCSRDGIPKRQLSEISHERRNGYSWYTTAATRLLTKDYSKWKMRISR